MDFKKQNTDWPAVLNTNSEHNINMIDGYLSAARILVNAVQDQYTLSDELVYPIMYLYRHHLELKIKSVWKCLWQLGKLPSDYPKHHRILELWQGCRKQAINIYRMSLEQGKNIDACIEEFNKVDSQAESFRFHEKKDGKRVGQVLPSLDIVLTTSQIEQCVEDLEGIMLFLFDKVENTPQKVV
jgi:hypothetical protein